MFPSEVFLIRQMTGSAEIKPVVIRHLVVVAFAHKIDVARGSRSAFSHQGINERIVVFLQRDSTACTCAIHKSGGYIPFLVDLVLERDTQVVLAVVFGMKGFAVIDDLPSRSNRRIVRDHV